MWSITTTSTIKFAVYGYDYEGHRSDITVFSIQSLSIGQIVIDPEKQFYRYDFTYEALEEDASVESNILVAEDYYCEASFSVNENIVNGHEWVFNFFAYTLDISVSVESGASPFDFSFIDDKEETYFFDQSGDFNFTRYDLKNDDGNPLSISVQNEDHKNHLDVNITVAFHISHVRKGDYFFKGVARTLTPSESLLIPIEPEVSFFSFLMWSSEKISMRLFEEGKVFQDFHFAKEKDHRGFVNLKELRKHIHDEGRMVMLNITNPDREKDVEMNGHFIFSNGKPQFQAFIPPCYLRLHPLREKQIFLLQNSTKIHVQFNSTLPVPFNVQKIGEKKPMETFKTSPFTYEYHRNDNIVILLKNPHNQTVDVILDMKMDFDFVKPNHDDLPVALVSFLVDFAVCFLLLIDFCLTYGAKNQARKWLFFCLRKKSKQDQSRFYESLNHHNDGGEEDIGIMERSSKEY